jgi:hypothetical protein
MTIDQRCAEALARIRRYVNLAAAQHLFHLRGKVRK